MSGGGSGGSAKTKTVKQTPIVPVPQAQVPTTGFSGMGPTPTPQSYTAEGKPAWMQGVWGNPNWGMSAANPQQALTQEMLQPQAAPQSTMPNFDLQGLLDQLKGLTTKEEKIPVDPRTMSTNKFLRAYLLKPKELKEKMSAYDEYQYEKAQGRRK